ncbi:MAG: ThiF family adenylyltransferase [Hyphomicrobiales bacterium]
MDKTAAIQEIHETLKLRGFNYTGPGACDYQGPIKVHGRPVEIRLLVPDVFFAQKPKAILIDRSQVPLETLAHIETDDGVCYASGAGLPLDFYQPGQAIMRVISEIERTLELSYKGRAKQEVVDEYQFYWKEHLNVRLFLPRSITPGVHCAFSFFACKGGDPIFIAVSQNKRLRGYKTEHLREALLWSLPESIGPANNIKVPDTLSELQAWLDGQPLLKGMAWGNARKILIEGGILVVAAPNAVVGIDFDIPKSINAAVKKGAIRKTKLPEFIQKSSRELQIKRYSATWSAFEDIASRNHLGSSSLQNRSIAVVGCGTIGSHLARMLLQSGAGMDARLTLFDNQYLSAGNVGRHLLGFSEIGEHKATATKSELERFHPEASVYAVEEDALAQWDMLKRHDLIVDATGEWNIQAALNDCFLKDRGEKLEGLLHSWIFMNGAGVQSFLNLGDDHACFRCLKPKFDGPWRYPAGDEKEELNLQPASCGDGSYVPFSVDASAMAASLANRAILDWAEGRPGKRLRTVVVDIERGRSQKPVSPKPSSNCPACASLREVN